MSKLRAVVERPPVVAEAHEPLSLVAQRMFDHQVDSVVLHAQDGSLEGIFTERDLVRACAAGVDSNAATVGSWMSRALVTAHATDHAEEALAAMIEHRIRHLPVLGQEGLIGVVSMRQLSQHLHEQRVG